jgi:hypothetical protein
MTSHSRSADDSMRPFRQHRAAPFALFALHGADVSEVAAAAPAKAYQRFWYWVKT